MTGPENKGNLNPLNRIRERLPGIEKFYHKFTNDRLVARERNAFFSEIDKRIKKSEMSQDDREHLAQVASDVYWYHFFGRPRLTGEPYVTHPYAVAAAVLKNPYIPFDELRNHAHLALTHDLEEETDITTEDLNELNKHPFVKKGMHLLTRFRKRLGGDSELRKDNFQRIMDKGDIGHKRVKIEDWAHNLKTTPRSTKTYLSPRKKDKVNKLHKKYRQTNEYIIPLIRTFPPGEREYHYEHVKDIYNTHKPFTGAPKLEPLIIAA